MPAPKFLSGLPKPVLFGFYGAVGGLLGALVFGELLWFLLRPPPPKPPDTPPQPQPQLVVSASKDLNIYQGGMGKVIVQLARAAFDEDVTVRVAGLPEGLTAPDVVVPKSKFNSKGEADAEIEIRATSSASVGTPRDLQVLAIATPPGKPTLSVGAPLRIATLAAPMPQADIVFVLDVTGSMQGQIDGLKNGIGTFANDLYKAKVDARFACVAFRDLYVVEADPINFPQMKMLNFDGKTFTSDASAFRDEVAKLRASGGGDIPETSFEALSVGATLNDKLYDKSGEKPDDRSDQWRKAAVRTLVLITDAPPKLVNMAGPKGQSVEATVKYLRDNKIDFLHLVINQVDEALFRQVQEGAIGTGEDKGTIDHGKVFDLGRVASNANEMTKKLLPDMTKAIVAAAEAKRPDAKPELAKPPEAKPVLQEGVKSLQSNEESQAGTEGLVVLRSGVWTGSVAALICVVLLGGQYHYLRGSMPPAGGVLAGLGGGLLVGLIGGAAGQGLFLLANTDNRIVDVLFRVMGWTILGSMAGAGLSLFVPNLKLVYGLVGGAVGGAVGALGYFAASYVASAVFGPDVGGPGRLAGGLVLGLFIGLMVAIVEAAFRSAWLEVRYGPREVVTVNLGAEPVKVGSDARACTVWARGAPEVALRYFIRNGKVICTDVPSRDEFAVADGDTREAGNVTVVVRTGSGKSPSAPAPRRPVPPPVRKAKPAPALKALDLEDEDDGLPMPISDLPPPPAPPPPPPPPPVRPAPASAPPRPPLPAATRPPAPAPTAGTPAIKPATRDPDACPSCGRKNAGRPGTRYCMVCDYTY